MQKSIHTYKTKKETLPKVKDTINFNALLVYSVLAKKICKIVIAIDKNIFHNSFPSSPTYEQTEILSFKI